MSGESEISELSANGEIYASAAAESLSDDAQNVTLILAVYDADGALSQVKINKQEITSGKVVELKTDSK